MAFIGGAAVFALLTFGWQGLPPVLLIHGVLSGLPWLMAPSPVSLPAWLVGHFALLLVTVAAYLLAALVLRAWNAGRTHNSFANQAYTGRFLGAALLGGGLAASADTLWLLYAGSITFDQWSTTWLRGMVGDFVGIVTITPLLLVHLSPRLRDWLQGIHWRQSSLGMGRGRWWLWAACFAGLLLTLVVLFRSPPWLGLNAASNPFLILFMLLPLAWIAIVGGLSMVTVAIFLLDAGLAMLAMWSERQDAALYYQMVMVAVALMGLLLGA